MSDHDDLTSTLTRELRTRADTIEGGRLGFADVQGRARGIRRRRTTSVVVAAAAAVAVLVPTAVAAGHRGGHVAQPLPPATQNVSPGPNTLPATYRVAIHSPEFTSTDPFLVPYEVVGRLNSPQGGSIAVAHPVLDPVLAADGSWSGISFHRGSYTWTSWDASGRVTDSHPASSGTLAATPDGTATAYVGNLAAPGETPDWRVVRTGPQAQTWRLAHAPQNGAGAVGILADGTVVFETEPGAVRLARPDGTVVDLPGDELGAASASADRIAVQLTSNRDGTSCWAVEDAAGTLRAHTCAYALGALSPDGNYVIGWPSDADNGLRTVSILDLATLTPLATFEARGNGSFASQLVWAGGSILASYTQGGRWYVEQLGITGIVQQSGVAIRSDPYGPPPFTFGAPARTS